MDIRTRAAGYINIKMRTEAQLRKHLTDKGYSSGDISEVVDEFKQYGYIDDLNYATLYYEYAFSKGRGLFRIKRELKSKGIDQDIIEEAYEMLDTKPDQFELAMDIGRQMTAGTDVSGLDYAEKQKLRGRIGRRLARRGFSSDTVYRVIDRLV